jgi:hypothetical protein
LSIADEKVGGPCELITLGHIDIELAIFSAFGPSRLQGFVKSSYCLEGLPPHEWSAAVPHEILQHNRGEHVALEVRGGAILWRYDVIYVYRDGPAIDQTGAWALVKPVKLTLDLLRVPKVVRVEESDQIRPRGFYPSITRCRNAFVRL